MKTFCSGVGLALPTRRLVRAANTCRFFWAPSREEGSILPSEHLLDSSHPAWQRLTWIWRRHQQDVRCEGHGLAIAADSFSTRQTPLLTLAGVRGRCWGFL
ncbi:unnamed protein product [Arctogadus glacialis]